MMDDLSLAPAPASTATAALPAAASSLSILVVEDHDDLREGVVELLEQQGHQVTGLDCAEALDDERAGRPLDLAIVDLNLPGEGGLSLVRRLRGAQPRACIIITTARTQLADRISGYESGADIYLAKPVDPAELLAAVQALSRRIQVSRPAAWPAEAGGPAMLTLDTGRLRVQGPAGEVSLSHTEVALLTALSRAASRRLQTWQLLDLLREATEAHSKAHLEIRFVRLRKKLTQAGAAGSPLRALRGQGYQLCIDLQVV